MDNSTLHTSLSSLLIGQSLDRGAEATHCVPMNSETTVRTEPRHTIRVVAERTGLTPDVLRVWERRYAVVTPARDEGGQRVYTDAELERLRLLRQATVAGRGIGSIAGMSTEELAALVREDAAARPPVPVLPARPDRSDEVEAAVDHIRAHDARGLDTFLRRRLTVLGVGAFLEEVVGPLLVRVGDEWHMGRMTIAQEHLSSAVVRQVLQGIVGTPDRDEEAPRVLVATPAGDQHELGALLAAASAYAHGWNVLYLGPNLPAREIADAAVAGGARLVALSLVYCPDAMHTVREIRELRALLPSGIPLLLGGAAALRMKDRMRMEGVRVGERLGEF
jgi:MerR family transcriptional regulator, light-induced transcriptional regulator